MGNQMSVGSFLSFGIENTKKHFLKFLGLSIISFVALGIGVAICAVLPELLWNAQIIISSLLVIFLSMIIGFGFYKNVLNLCRGDKVNIMVFTEAKPETILNFFVLMLLMSIALTIGYTLFIVPGIILTVMLLPAPFLVIDRDMGPIEAISESIKITNGHKMDIFAGFFISMAVAYILSIFVITLIFTIPMSMFIYVYPYLQLTGQLDEAKKNLEANA
jgi:uncharacterized membrane protein